MYVHTVYVPFFGMSDLSKSSIMMNEGERGEHRSLESTSIMSLPPCPIPNQDLRMKQDISEEYDADEIIEGIAFVDYRNEAQLPDVMRLVGADLSEPYSIFTYRYFLHQYPDLCIFAVPVQSSSEDIDTDPIYDSPIGCVVCKIDKVRRKTSHDVGNKESNSSFTLSGYMGMLAVNEKYRRLGIGKALLKRVIRRMKNKGCVSVTLETETSNTSATALYEKLGFIKEELLVRYYLNLGDAYRMRLYFS